MTKEDKIRIETLDAVISHIKQEVMKLQDDMNRDNYISYQDRKIGMQTVLCMVAEMKWEMVKEAEKDQ